VEVLSGFADVVGLLQAARGVLGRNHGFDVELRACVERALRDALDAQGAPVDAPVTALLTPLGAVGATDVFLPDQLMIAADDAPTRWAEILRSLVTSTDVLDTSRIDVARLSTEFGTRLALEVKSSAAQPGSPFFTAYVVSHLEDKSLRPAVERVDVPPTSISNMWSLPLAAASVERPETAAVVQMLESVGMAVIVGGPGSGKSVIARTLAHDRAARSSASLVWWITASTSEQMTGACESLLREAGEAPTADPRAQVRALLAKRDDWFIVIDDAIDLADVSSIVPGGALSGQVVITTKATTFPSDRVVVLSAADDGVLTKIARSILPASTPDEAIGRLVTLCQGSPLAIATCSHFVTSTGMRIDEVVELVEDAPSHVLSTEIGPGYPSSFDEIVRRALTDAETRAPLASTVMAIMAMCGGSDVTRTVVRAALATDPLIEFTAAVRVLREVGLLEFGPETLRCHALVAAISRDRLGDDALRVAGDRVLTAAASLSRPAAGFDPLILAALVDVVDSRGVASIEPLIGARIALADALDRDGLIASARRQTDALRSLPETELDRGADVVFTLTEARVLLAGGEAAAALSRSREGVAKLDSLAIDDVAELPELRAGFHVIEMWASTQLGAWDDARDAWASAQAAAPDNLELRQLGMHLTLVDSTPAQRAGAFAGLASAAGLGDGDTGYYYGMASRAAIDAGLTDLAIDYAQRAIAADTADFGEGSSSVARDRNDLGMAFFAADRLDEAESMLKSSLAFYERETFHPNSAMPRLHLGRILSARARRAKGSQADALWTEARVILRSAADNHAKRAPRSAEQAALLYALAETYEQDRPDRAVALLMEALRIDRDIFGDRSADVGHDVARLMESHLGTGDASAALEVFGLVKSSVPEWEQSAPGVAASLLAAQLRCLVRMPITSLRHVELSSVIRRLENLTVRHPVGRWATALPELILEGRRVLAGQST
jgi:tetratricopeptide (TPR) repeat protein